ncbi:globin domain-containing protein [Streptomyces gilvosporeus]|uniref:nitric oxide dioxygenase n=1 Tax=Streptomyces gilvosporeus TaxID=553510 RepID=A0A1V0TU81_9ACTN|nr:globin domain-containing protein [Streptomyces gilvosporeus]ARF56433.1 flavohemoprotein [Streptomyces gilvosporeus]
MDAPTTTSADNGSSGGSSGDWGWFTPPSKKSSETQRDQQQSPDDQGGPGDRGAADGQEGQGRERIPSRPVNPIRPVGTAAERERVPEPRQEPQSRQAPQQSQQAQPSQEAWTPQEPLPPRKTPQGQESPLYREPRPSWEPEPVHESVHSTGVGSGPTPAAAPAAEPAPRPFFTPPEHQVERQAERRSEPQADREAAVRRPVAQEPTLGAVEAAASAAPSASPDALLIRQTMAEIEPVADKVTSYFYALLFVRYPDLRALFPASMDTQRDRLFKALLTAAKHVDDADILTEYLTHLGRGHRKYGTLPDHYPAVGECLLSALSRYATSSWSQETEDAWVRAYTAISQIMIDAAAENEAVAPAWWQAEVVSHELRTPDIAVVTVRPDQPYPFLAGQYTSLETPWWPRVWRHYSFASAPRSDGLLSFHVKAVPAGWVSNAMVHRARPGDVIRLGAPGGSMTVDHTTRTGMLCVGGGTGIAPIKALIEDVAQHGVRRPVDVFYGARSDHDLYDIDTMLRLEQEHPWLQVRPVVANGPTGRGGASTVTGQLPDAVRKYGPFPEYDAYLSGPPGMIRRGVDALVGVGIPSGRIRHDSIEELVSTGD